jgi:hypothetical protein
MLSNLTYVTGYASSTFTCYTDIMDNVSSNICHGQIAVIPVNQDIIVAMQIIQTFAIVLIAFYCLFKFALAR